ncbi:MAG TPA: DNA polymerase III subunit beta [Bdellovibrionales bacterium]|nr:DNA polymerase III subunit beta [Pseudobdellovibrionaceae bacterium]HAG90568.1 DNA polymerase III subunit beta [Bdellovibrionales bacterium]
MRLEVEKKDLLTLLSRSQNIVEKRNTMPILVNVLLEAEDHHLKVFATDLEVSLKDQIPAQISQPGKVAVSAKSLFEIIKELPEGPIALEKRENNWLRVTQKKSVFNLVGMSPEEYPVFPTFQTNQFIEMDSDILSEMIEKTLYSVSTDETRYHLNGVYFENRKDDHSIRMVATDGHRLSMVDRKTSGSDQLNLDAGVIVPRKGLNEIKKLLDSTSDSIELAIEGSQLILRKDNTLLLIRLIEGRYPNYLQLVPKNLKETLRAPKETLLSSLKRVSLLSNAKSKGVTLSLSNGKMEIASNNPELGDAKEEIEVDYKGKDIRIGFNAKYILDVLGAIKEDIIEIDFNDNLSPGVVRPDKDQSYTCVVMPMRI